MRDAGKRQDGRAHRGVLQTERGAAQGQCRAQDDVCVVLRREAEVAAAPHQSDAEQRLRQHVA